MDNSNYTLRELSEELDISIRDLRNCISKGKLRAKKVGRAYSVDSADLDDFINARFETRNYMCENYAKCLDRAARENTSFGCDNCKKLSQSGSLMDDVFPLWDSGFSFPLSM